MTSNTLKLLAKFILLAGLITALSGCSTHKAQHTTNPVHNETDLQADTEPDSDFFLEEEFSDNTSGSRFDPLSGYNRFMTQVNDRVYFWGLKPLAQGYRAIVPEPGRLAVGRFFRNLMMPIRFTNNLLQLKPKQAATELSRFAINSTIGVLGFADPAKKVFDLQSYPEDFGQTLGHYGVGSGVHIVLPLLGPSNLRDTIGMAPDYYLSPIRYIDQWEVKLALRAINVVNQTSLRIGEYESIKKDALDLYPFLREAYEQRRNKLIEE